MKDKSAWIQLIAALSFSGGGTSILVYFREELPSPFFFASILLLIWIVFVVSLVRFLFGDQIYKWYTERKRYRMRVKTARELLDKWMKLEELVSELVRNGWQLNKQHKDKYFALHFWFNNNRVKFLPLWRNFHANRTYAAHERGGYSSASLYHQVFHDNYEDPFSYFYEPQTVEMLERTLQYNRGTELNHVLAKLTELTSEFVEWVKLR